MSKLILKNTRQFSALTLVVGAALLIFFSFTDRSRSASPASGTLNPAGPNVTWNGTALGGTSPEGELTCTPATCDAFTLTLSGTPATWLGKKARIVVSWANAGDDYDVYIHKGPITGPLVGSAAAGGAGPETIDLDPSNPAIGTGVFTVNVVYWLVAPPAVQYQAVASAVGAPTPTPTPTPGGSPTPTPTPAPPGTPRFVNHYAPPGVLEDAGEPTIGVNWKTENVSRPTAGAQTFKTTNRATGVQTTVFNGGTSLYYGGINNYFLRANFDDCSSPAGVDWAQIQLTTGNATRVFYDPILFTDHITGRTFVCQEAGLTPAGSTIEWTDNDGDQMYASEGAAPSGGIDHQTIGGGPWHAPVPANLVPTPRIPTNPPGPPQAPVPYPHAVYYASQNVASATAQTSLDGGFSFPTNSPMFTASDCAGLHGHLKVAEDGTAFVPDKACSPAGVPFVFGGSPSVAVSEDNGLTWEVRLVEAADSDAGADDPSVGVSWCPPGVHPITGLPIACDKAARSNHIYLGFMYTDGRPGVAYSNNKGQSWVNVTDLGAQAGIKHIAFPEVAVGDPDRAVFSFFGTTTEGNYSAPEFPGIWHLYVATTYNAGVTWTVQNISPEGPIQRGGICGDGTCRNLLDFYDATVDKEGRIMIAGQDGCIGGCEIGGPNSFTAKAFITRQTGGKRMFSIYDAQTAEPRLPGAPALSGSFDGTKVSLSWPVPDNGGSLITQYRVFRATSAAGPFTGAPLATVTQPSYVDNSPPVGNKFYVVTAVNAVGEGPYCKPFAPASGPLASPCDLPGLLVSNDLLQNGTDNDSGVNTPVDPRVNAKQLFVAEPFVAAGTEQIFFTLQVAPSTAGSAPPNSQWFIVWNREAPDANHDRLYVAMRTNISGTPSFEYGRFGVALDPTNPNQNANTPQFVGAADAGSSYNPLTGVILIKISNSKLRTIDGGASAYQPGDDLSAVNVRTYFNRPDPGQRSQNNASDITPDGSPYILVGNASCADAPQLVRAVSRRLHGPSGNFDIRLQPPATPGTVAIEPRVADTGNVYHIVMTFASPVTFTDVTVTGGTEANTTASGNDVIVNVTPTSEKNRVTVTLVGATTGGAPTNFVVPVDVLVGDSNLDRRVNVGDTNFVRSRSGQITNADNFIADLNCDGRVNVGDTNVARSRSGNSLP
jgi:hypothetical protein